MAKSAINILQEHCITEYKKYPAYLAQDTSTGSSPLFTVECVVNNTRTSGIASSKIVAKTEAAEQMIMKLGLTKPRNLTTSRFSILQSPPRLTDNYVGGLNEYCSKNSHLYPQYYESMDGTTFVTHCAHRGISSIGKGSNKKIAKQESAKAMLELCNKQSKTFTTTTTTNNNDLIDLGSLSIQEFCKPPAATSYSQSNQPSQVVESPKSALNLSNLDAVSAMNFYCDKYKYTKPEYFDCGKEGNVYTTKCKYQSFMVKGTGLTTKFAKQESARQMLEMIGIQHGDTNQTQQPTKDVDLIDMNDNPVPFQPVYKNTPIFPDNATILDLYKKNAPRLDKSENTSDTVDELRSFFDALEEKAVDGGNLSHAPLRKILNDSKVKYDIEVLQTHDPCIMQLSGKRLMDDGSVIDRHLLEMGDKRQEIIGALLTKAISSFQC